MTFAADIFAALATSLLSTAGTWRVLEGRAEDSTGERVVIFVIAAALFYATVRLLQNAGA